MRVFYFVLLSITLLVVTALTGGCDIPEPKFSNQYYTQIEKENWSGWALYTIRHNRTGACFVALEPGGEGGGGITSVPKEMCEVTVESK